MNPNIETILPDLWGVNMEWVEAGFIPGIKLISGTKEIINLSSDGKIILDKQAKSYDGLKFFFKKAMRFSDQELKAKFYYAKKFKDADSGVDLWYNILGFEIKRREIKQVGKKPSFFHRLKEMGQWFFHEAGDS